MQINNKYVTAETAILRDAAVAGRAAFAARFRVIAFLVPTTSGKLSLARRKFSLVSVAYLITFLPFR